MTLLTPAAIRDWRVRMAALLLGAALIVLVVMSIGAIRVDAVNAAAPPASVPDSALAFAPPGRGIDVAAANARDLHGASVVGPELDTLALFERGAAQRAGHDGAEAAHREHAIDR